jgi:hypothetical protein
MGVVEKVRPHQLIIHGTHRKKDSLNPIREWMCTEITSFQDVWNAVHLPRAGFQASPLAVDLDGLWTTVEGRD